MVRLLRFLGQLSGVAAGLLLLPWAAFALYAYAVMNNGGGLWSHPAMATLLRAELTLAAICASLLALAETVERTNRRKADSGGDK